MLIPVKPAGTAAVLLCATVFSTGVYAHEAGPTPDSHAPMGVMGDHTHNAGEWMFSYRFMNMSMKDNKKGRDSISPEQIVSTVSSPFAGQPMQPQTLRVVPLEMTTQMHMLGLMYAPSDKVTLMLMANYIEKEMDHLTFQGGSGTTRLGKFTTDNRGWGDTKIGALIPVYEQGKHSVHLNAGLSLPTGSIDEEDDVLTPMNTRPTLRMPYAMQLGSGTYDLEPGVTYNGRDGLVSWGGQYKAVVRLGENDEDYTLGDKHELTGWGAYRVLPWMSTSLRLTARTEDAIDGDDSRIRAPIQTANPENYGGDFVDVAIGANLVGQSGAIRGQRLGAELSLPVHQDYNGVQMEMDWMFTLAYQYSW